MDFINFMRRYKVKDIIFICSNCNRNITGKKYWTSKTYPGNMFHSFWCLIKFYFKQEMIKRGIYERR